MRISLTAAVLVILEVVSLGNLGGIGILAVAAAAPKVIIAPKNVETDPMYIYSCAVHQPAEVLERLWTDITHRIRDNKEYPGQLVRDMVDLACVQRNLFGFTDDSGSRAELKMRFSNYMYSFLMDVVDNFKVAMKRLLDRIDAEEAAELTHHFRAVPARDMLSIDPLLIASHPKAFRAERTRVHEVIRQFVDIRTILVERFVSAYPLLLHVSSKVELTNDVFKGAAPKRAGVITVAPGSGAPKTTSRPTASR